jgi:ParB family chromosome partitioning protein
MSALPAPKTLLRVKVAEVDDTQRLRPIDMDYAAALAAHMREHGPLVPIDVCQMPGKSGFRLVFGGHRMAAYRINEWDEVDALLGSANALDRMSRELAENLMRLDLSPLDQARFVTKLIETEKARLGIEGAQDGRALNADVRSEKAKKKQLDDDLCIVHKSLGLQETVAVKLGLHRSSVSRTLALNGIPPSLQERVRKLKIADNAAALRKLAGFHWSDQGDLIKLMEDGKSLADAIAIVKKIPVLAPETKRLSTFVDTYGRMGRKERIIALRELAKMVPDSVSIIFAADKLEAAE